MSLKRKKGHCGGKYIFPQKGGYAGLSKVIEFGLDALLGTVGNPLVGLGEETVGFGDVGNAGRGDIGFAGLGGGLRAPPCICGFAGCGFAACGSGLTS